MNDTAIPTRPRYGSQEVRALAIEAMLDDLIEWLDGSDIDRDRVSNQLAASFERNGYDFARSLDRRHGWEPDARLVEILDNADLSSAHRKVQSDWVKAYGVVVPFTVGDYVSTASYPKARIAAIWPATAEIVLVPEREKERWSEQPGCGYVVAFEQATALVGTLGEEVSA
ncbi:hypothetical protein ASC97_05805 [Rhizobium sp. Root1203]|uniref:hypothetical protein n=1 Tax=Rhizobium sp. Root1203 TaxID=1736427 RepID=UPI00070B8E0D|nr:hypothetical protein [Rhizobium sp. Root1203]KQV27876.1 hypothetical protein ASC97_05805 [Rhizobium sp. Root1203]